MSDTTTQLSDPPAKLITHLNQGDCVLFIGADLPRAVTGLPSRADLARELVHRHGLDEALSLAEVAQRVGQAGNRYEFTSFLRDQLDTAGQAPQPFHRRIVELVQVHSITTLITTAYDNLLERAFQEAGLPLNRVVRDSDLAFTRRDRPTFLKLYGDAQQVDTLVVTADDHHGLGRDRDKENLLDAVRAALRQNVVLFLGYNLADPDFNLLWREVLDRAGRFARGGYAVWRGLPEADVRMWRDRGITILEADPLGDAAASPILPGTQPDSKEGIGEQEAPVTPPTPIQYGAGHHWAVLVGVNEYEDEKNYGQLQVCVKDVHAIREQLVAGGFDPARIRLLTDRMGEYPTRARVLAALQAVAQATEPDDLLLFYYSGHGDAAGDESYLVARDGQRLVLDDTGVPVSRVKEILGQAPARAKVIVLDACHSGADIGGKGPRPMSAAFIQRVFEQAAGLAILASCQQGQLSYEWRAQERSVFTHYLLEALAGEADRDEKGFVTVQDASRHVTNGVKLWASQHNASQTPTLEYTVAGDIILTRLKSLQDSDKGLESVVEKAEPEPHPSLALKLSVKPETVNTGDEATWTTTLRNDGGDDLHHVTVRHGRTLLDDPFDLAVGRGRRFTFTTTPATAGQKTEKVTATGIASNGATVRRDALATVQVRSPHPVASELDLPRRRQMPVLPAPEVVTITAPIHLELVHVPAGEFLMGSDAKDGDAHDDERPQHSVYVPEFYMGRHPVTNEQYAAFVEATGRRVPSHWQAGKIPSGKENHPVVHVSWLDVRAFCKWLSQETGQNFRLPTEAEWEKAASWDERVDQKWRYPWGDRFDQTRCNAKASSIGGTTLVGEYSPAGDSPYGCADMAGNVWDWTSSLYQEYPYHTDDGREDPTGSDSRVLRGGSFNSPVGRARAAFRLAKFTDFSDERRGCRVCATAPLNIEALNVAASPVPPSRPDGQPQYPQSCPD